MTVTLRAKDHTYWTDGGVQLPSVSAILEATGVRRPYMGPAIYGQRGTYVHEATELIDQKDLAWDGVYKEWEGYLRAYEKFLAENEVEWEATEEIVFRPGFYAGTPDRRGKVNRRRVMPDFKTGSPDRTHWLQLAAYNATFPREKRYEPRVLYLGKNGLYTFVAHTEREAEQDVAVWEAVLTVYLWKEGRL